MFSTEFSFLLEAAYREASGRKHAYFCIEHILYSLLQDAEIQDIINNVGGDLEALKKKLEEFFDQQIDLVSEEDPQHELEANEVTPIQTQGVENILQRSIIHMLSLIHI